MPLFAAAILALCFCVLALAPRIAFATPLAPRLPMGTVVPTETPAACRLAWRVGATSNTGPDDNVFNGVAAISPDDVWVVGYYSEGMLARTLVMHWDGSAWTAVPSPNRGQSTNILSAVVAISSDDVWAVGHYFNGALTDTLVLHWDGTSWRVVDSPNMNVVGNFLTAVSAPPGSTGGDVWAVGQYYTGSSFRTLTEHWDGSAWSIVPSPNPGENDNRLRGVTATSATDVWAVGYFYAVDDYFTLTMHWNGTNWALVNSPNVGPGANYLRAVSALSPGDVWAVGNYSLNGTGPFQTIAMHWDGTTWGMVATPNPSIANNYLRGVTAISSNDAWAVGYYDTEVGVQMDTLTLHWDGTQWSQVPSPNAGSINQLFAISSTSSDDVWAVGLWDTTGQYQTLVERYNDPCAGTTATPTATPPAPTATATTTPTPTSTSTNIPSTTWTPLSTSTPSPSGTPPATLTSTPTGPAPATSTSTPCPIAFTDVQPTDYFYEPVRYLFCRRAVSGYTGGTFRPYNLTTRGQLSKIVVLVEGWGIYVPSRPTFSDVPTTDTFYQYTETAYSHAIISGYACGPNCLEFRPNNNVTRGQLCKIVVLAQAWTPYTPTSPTFQDAPATNPFYQYIETAYSHAIISGYACGPNCLEFHPGNNATRGQISKVVAGAGDRR